MAERKPYDSPVRRQRMEVTRERIVAAGVELVRGFKTWDWSELTFRADRALEERFAPYRARFASFLG